jgi:hypothetical protein
MLKKIYEYMLKYKDEHGQLPSCGVSARKFKMTRQNMNLYYAQLIKQGKIKKNEDVSHFLLV